MLARCGDAFRACPRRARRCARPPGFRSTLMASPLNMAARRPAKSTAPASCRKASTAFGVRCVLEKSKRSPPLPEPVREAIRLRPEQVAQVRHRQCLQRVPGGGNGGIGHKSGGLPVFERADVSYRLPRFARGKAGKIAPSHVLDASSPPPKCLGAAPLWATHKGKPAIL